MHALLKNKKNEYMIMEIWEDEIINSYGPFNVPTITYIQYNLPIPMKQLISFGEWVDEFKESKTKYNQVTKELSEKNIDNIIIDNSSIKVKKLNSTDKEELLCLLDLELI